ncbi:MAG: class I SAM-dependent methyltransferase [Desulfarculus sp.]|nr:class I SAM-dependent methyltransferase [Pseudomonadota bacterium]MBV1714979.1 class I SAM-dependent methyltransferase [Desulfarculus sp.]MBU4573903.1 class I SAM-dependent methyltransferase [Pseudomonadota bacterium]MBU4598968.1 class I SAM-dependent methyltransferase [Pseudomonadota bacterium]MBV1737479.1 class I SAM-dependent methyltransferase [Desulfarculus sp.]
MNYSTYFSKQARKPTGIFGRFRMSRIFEKGNAELNALVFKTVSVEDNDHALEIGSGTGTLIKDIADTISKGLIEGIDFSKPMVSIARKKNKKHINGGKVKIHLGDFDQVVFDPNSFDKIFTVNTVYFWKNPDATIAEIHRILKPGGKLVIGFHDKSEMKKMPLNKDVFKYYSTHDFQELLLNHGGLDNIEIVSKSGGQKVSYCAVCMKSEA